MRVVLPFLLLLLFECVLLADPSPFGLEIRKVTIEEAKAKYSIEYTGVNEWNNGEMYTIDSKDLEFEGLESVTLIFGEDQKLQAVLTTLSKDRFDALFASLKKKYKLISSSIPFVGDASAKFTNGNTEISLNAPHMSFEMEMNYMDKCFIQKYKNKSSKKKQLKTSSEESQL
jgi:hypothetical protein